MKLLRDERGQSMAFPLIALTTILGMTAFVADVGGWFRADRHMQAVADAAALAAAQALPHDPGKAVALAQDYAEKNGGPSAQEIVVFKDKKKNDSVRVRYQKPAPGIFSRIFKIDSVTVGATASARASVPSAARFVAPIVVHEQHPILQCSPTPCFGTQTELSYMHLKSNGTWEGSGAGSFGFLDLGSGGTGTSTLKEQIAKGWSEIMPLGNYSARTGNPFNAVESDLKARIGSEMLFPVYRTISQSGTNAKYEIIGWVSFVITALDIKAGNEKLFGYFTRVVWAGLPAYDDDDDDGASDFGAMVVHLTK